ncbi:cyclophilin-like fold protein [Rhodobacter maris]|uniref:Cyclophilin-like domain-containing protein n=1 Tax=Rhodobacter maris TaxID=446682 RepID=A0A285SGH3_9RHOB|nr:cyclophilin-like fold protein [Rhodobacter maris]SOC07032.1 hypothetical protein SAMN05877831_105202 [Rhodobacter maris]
MLRRTCLMACLALAAPGLLPAQTPASMEPPTMIQIRVILPDATLTATLNDSATARDFAAILPRDLVLTDYHGIERIADLPRRLDTTGAPRSYKPATGDITLYAPWGNLAIFLKPFSSAPGLVPLGRFDGPVTALDRSGPVTARFERAE